MQEETKKNIEDPFLEKQHTYTDRSRIGLGLVVTRLGYAES